MASFTGTLIDTGSYSSVILGLNRHAALTSGVAMPDTRQSEPITFTGKFTEPIFGMTAAAQQGLNAFHADLPELLKTHPGWYAAYSGNQRLGLGKSDYDLIRHFMDMGMSVDDIMVLPIEPYLEVEMD
jgi:hypothetical protein